MTSRDSRANLIDRAIAYVAPVAAARRLQARNVFELSSGAYKGASRTRDALAGWQVARGAPDDLAAYDLPTLRERSADLLRNNALASGSAHTKIQGVVGTGLKLNAGIDRDYLGLDDETADAWEARAEHLWRTWAESKDCHVKRTLNFFEQQEIAFRAVLAAGDHFVQLTRAEASELPFRLACQHIVADRVSNPHSGIDTDTCVQGVEKTASGAPLAYHVFDGHPQAMRIGAKRNWTRIPAFGANGNHRVTLHLYRALADDQTRGIPDLAPVIEPLKQLDRYTDAELDAAVKTAIWALMVRSETGEGLAGLVGQEWVEKRSEYYGKNPIDLQAQGGRAIGLFPDDHIEAFDPSRPNSAYDPFVSSIFKQIGVALELPYEVLTKAFQSSYSAARAALLQAWQFFNGRRVWLAANFCQPVYGAFIDEQVAEGRLAAPGYFADPLIRAAYLGAEWIGDAPGHIDETKAVAAAVARVENGFSTVKRETAALTGEDSDQVRRQRDKERRQGAGAAVETPVAPAQPPPQQPPAQPSAEDLDKHDLDPDWRGVGTP